jgi:hypothetical protein
MEIWHIVFRVYMAILSVPPLLALAVVVAAFWFGGWLWGLPLFLMALAVYGPLLALPFIFPEIARTVEKFGFSR